MTNSSKSRTAGDEAMYFMVSRVEMIIESSLEWKDSNFSGSDSRCSKTSRPWYFPVRSNSSSLSSRRSSRVGFLLVIARSSGLTGAVVDEPALVELDVVRRRNEQGRGGVLDHGRAVDDIPGLQLVHL